mgnify:CR=1 FL=1
MNEKKIYAQSLISIEEIDAKLSLRFIELDPKGYFLIRINAEANELVVEYFTNDLDSDGRALDPATGKPIKCKGGEKRFPQRIYKGKTAKELGIKLTEGNLPLPLSRLDHALYLGRELQKAETALKQGKNYIQD